MPKPSEPSIMDPRSSALAAATFPGDVTGENAPANIQARHEQAQRELDEIRAARHAKEDAVRKGRVDGQ